MRWWIAGLLLAGMLTAAGAPSAAAVPPAQATNTPTATPTNTPTATPTPTLPPFRAFSDEWGVQNLPAAGVNCFVAGERPYVGAMACIAGTPVP